MFTGIIRAKGTVSALEKRGGDARLSIRAVGLPWSEYVVGESIAVNGVCLTAVAYAADGFETDVSTATLDVTTLGRLTVGSAVNLEPSLALGERLGGHFVSGHVDCVGTVRSRVSDARSLRLGIDMPREYARYVARKGSVAVDGVSLTINEISASGIEVNIIPHTAEATITDNYDIGTIVNIEVDLLARYLERLLGSGERGLTREFLEANGYV